MRSMKKNILIVSGLACLALSGCADKYSPDVYNPAGMQQTGKVDRAVVKSVRTVDVNDPSLGLGTAAGAAAGGIAGSQIGKGGGNAIAILGGVLIGGGIGYLVDQDVNATKAFEYILEKSDGELLTLAQKQEEPYALNSRVLILYGAKARVIPDTTDASPKVTK